MNWKITPLKLIVTIVLSVLIGYYFGSIVYRNQFGINQSIVGFVLSLILIYVVWSLVQKRR